MPNDDLEAAINARITELKAMAQRHLAAVRRAKAAARKAGLLGIYKVAVKREQQIVEVLKAMEADAPNDVE